ncbi:Os02g0495650 [Oryza sativa Japonica Group]|uniref:Os02g0495650 protein n=4 Tax=Oryza TaxID=4527 RepID=A0A0P0VJ87_ORYSJ|nr:Os02g0495650 [Oryza sativa Japonica Group]
MSDQSFTVLVFSSALITAIHCASSSQAELHASSPASFPRSACSTSSVVARAEQIPEPALLLRLPSPLPPPPDFLRRDVERRDTGTVIDGGEGREVDPAH